ncbi:MAG: hypothetical protein ACE5EM_01360 [Sphingomonadales bacterium]
MINTLEAINALLPIINSALGSGIALMNMLQAAAAENRDLTDQEKAEIDRLLSEAEANWATVVERA